ncbi:major fimbrial subunit protein FimA [Dysgonomonas alginatilytica]|uniref:Major fimbrial subunit protein FimA n=1 Tax=Dysgonomonas alginatilytica TaxID=1605892 RepID=A0A2V3PQC6_9BACT|nr:fimbrial protein [Dysgonomonas alginatilytica]PXV63354.1 major fimbrial subunit protein FimA [Dysgonomonas alginatilytica]
MKLKNLFLLGSIALMTMSCEKSEDSVEASPMISVKSASISLQIAGSDDLGTRSSGSPTQEEKVLKLDAFVFNADGSLEAYKPATSSVNTITKVDNIAVTSGAKKIFVLANYAGDASLIKTLDDLKKVSADLKNEKDNGRLIMSTDLADVTILPGKNYIGYASGVTDGTSLAPHSYSLTRLVSRVKIEDMQWQSSEYTFEDQTAFVLNAAKNSFIVSATSVSAPSSYYEGLAGSGDLFPSESTVLSGADNFLTTVAGNNNTYFYLYENQPVNSVMNYPTILVIRAKVKRSNVYVSNIPGRVDANGYTYFPVIINKEGTSSTVTGATDGHTYIKRNNTYSVKTVVKGLGTSNPFSSESPSSLNAQVNVAAWALNISQTNVFE